MPAPSRRKLYRLGALLLLASVALVMGTRYWRDFRLKDTLKRRIVQAVNASKIIQLESLDFSWDLKDLRQGRVRGVVLEGVHIDTQTRFRLEGDLQTSLTLARLGQLDFDFSDIDAQLELHRLWLHDGALRSLSRGLTLRGSAEVHRHEGLATATGAFRLQGENLSYAGQNVSFSDVQIDAHLEKEQLSAVFRTAEIKSWPADKNPDDESIRLVKPRLESKVVVASQEPFQFGMLSFRSVPEKLEWVRGMNFLVLENQDIALSGRLDPKASPLTFDVSVPAWNIRLSRSRRSDMRVHVDGLEIASVLQKLQSIQSLAGFSSWMWKSGRLNLDATLAADLSGLPKALALSLDDVEAKSTDQRLAVQGANVRIQSRAGSRKLRVSISAERAVHERLELSVPEQRLEFSIINDQALAWAAGSRLELRLAGKPISIDAIKGTLSLKGPDLEFSVQSPPIPLAAISTGYCLGFPKPLPGTFQIQIRKVEWTPDEFHVFGDVRADTFGGFARLYGIAFFDYMSEVPETQFDAEWGDLSLEQVGDWMGFGRMDGQIRGHMRDSVFQKSLPTQYDFRLELAPTKGKAIEFSPEAMRNFIKTFAGEAIDNIPGIANWLAFGWPAKFLGFFNIDYAGIALKSENGFIRVDTLRPGERYILKGFRIKVPLNAPTDPLIVDAYAMGSFIRQLKRQFTQIVKAKKTGPDDQKPEFLIDAADREAEEAAAQGTAASSCFDPGF